MKQQALGVLGFGSIIGLEEAIMTNSEVYSTTVVCARYDKNMNSAELYRIDAAAFKSKIQGQNVSS